MSDKNPTVTSQEGEFSIKVRAAAVELVAKQNESRIPIRLLGADARPILQHMPVGFFTNDF
jgi:hypothetical protein